MPAKVTVAPVWRLCKSIVLDGGADMLDNTISVHDFTADEIDAYSVTMHAEPVATATEADVAEDVMTADEVDSELVVDSELEVTFELVMNVVAAVTVGTVTEAVLPEAGWVVVAKVL